MAMILIDSHCRVGPSAMAGTDGTIGSKIRMAKSPLLWKVVRLYIIILTRVNKIFGRCSGTFQSGHKKSIDVDDCNLAVDMGIEERLQILDATKRMRLVHKIDTRL
jgi:hypothetical protein